MKNKTDAWRQGYKASRNGSDASENPYLPSENDHALWNSGFVYASDEASERLPNGAKKRRREYGIGGDDSIALLRGKRRRDAFAVALADPFAFAA